MATGAARGRECKRCGEWTGQLRHRSGEQVLTGHESFLRDGDGRAIAGTDSERVAGAVVPRASRKNSTPLPTPPTFPQPTPQQPAILRPTSLEEAVAAAILSAGQWERVGQEEPEMADVGSFLPGFPRSGPRRSGLLPARVLAFVQGKTRAPSLGRDTARERQAHPSALRDVRHTFTCVLHLSLCMRHTFTCVTRPHLCGTLLHLCATQLHL